MNLDQNKQEKHTDFFIPCKDKKSLRRGGAHLYRVKCIVIQSAEKEIPTSSMFLQARSSLLRLHLFHLLQLAHICPQLHTFCTVCPHPRAQEQIKSRQKATLRSQCFANRAQSAIIRT